MIFINIRVLYFLLVIFLVLFPMSISLINYVKYNKTIYYLYNIIGSCFISLLKLFVRKDNSLIVFVSFGGRKFDDSPKAIYDKITQDTRFSNYKLCWAFINPEKFVVPKGEKIKIDTLQYYLTILKARVWITNSGVERGLNFKGKDVLYFNTWHGSAIKLMGKDIVEGNASMGGDNKGRKNNNIDIMLAQSKYDVDIFTNAFNIPRSNFKIVGLPRNDELVSNTAKEHIIDIKRSLRIDGSKKVILYAPTFREYTKDSKNNCILTPPINLKKWEKILHEEFVILFRAHYEVVKMMSIEDSDFVYNVSDYPSLNDLMLISDILISDYSSIFFDYSILNRPMLSFCYDYDTYAKNRGMYFDVRDYLNSYDNEDSLLMKLSTNDFSSDIVKTIAFREKFVEAYGNASQESLNIISKQLGL